MVSYQMMRYTGIGTHVCNYTAMHVSTWHTRGRSHAYDQPMGINVHVSLARAAIGRRRSMYTWGL